MVGDMIFNAEFAEPAIGQIDLHLRAKLPLRPNCKHIADEQHPDHQHRINRGPTSVRVIRCELPVHPAQVENAIDLADQMIRWHHLVEIKRIKELTLPVLPSTHHKPLPQMSVSKERNHGSRVVSIGVLQHNHPDSCRWRRKYTVAPHSSNGLSMWVGADYHQLCR